jgi:type IV secretory pathway component VirB8
MTMFSYINQNIDRIRYEVKIGLIPCAILKHWQIYSRYDYWKRLNNSTSNSVVLICNEYQVAPSWVYMIIKRMEDKL